MARLTADEITAARALLAADDGIDPVMERRIAGLILQDEARERLELEMANEMRLAAVLDLSGVLEDRRQAVAEVEAVEQERTSRELLDAWEKRFPTRDLTVRPSAPENRPPARAVRGVPQTADENFRARRERMLPTRQQEDVLRRWQAQNPGVIGSKFNRP